MSMKKLNQDMKKGDKDDKKKKEIPIPYDGCKKKPTKKEAAPAPKVPAKVPAAKPTKLNKDDMAKKMAALRKMKKK